MTHSLLARPPARRRRIRPIRAAGLLLGGAVLIGLLGQASRASSSMPVAAPSDLARHERAVAPDPTAVVGSDAGQGPAIPRALGEADGAIPRGTTVFSEGVAGVAKLDPALLAALRRAATRASSEGIRFTVDSGWRSGAYQEQLRRDAIATYGSEEEAARWVATPETSRHVSGDAVDLGSSDATAWLSRHGASFGLCQVYANEPWHYELRPDAVAHGCPAMYADPTHDPRMHK